jgi:hypothetical protein
MLGFFFLCFFISALYWLTPFSEAMVLTTASGAKRTAAYRLLAPLIRGTLSGFLVLLIILTTVSLGSLVHPGGGSNFGNSYPVPAFHDQWRVESILCANLKPVILI